MPDNPLLDVLREVADRLAPPETNFAPVEAFLQGVTLPLPGWEFIAEHSTLNGVKRRAVVPGGKAMRRFDGALCNISLDIRPCVALHVSFSHANGDIPVSECQKLLGDLFPGRPFTHCPSPLRGSPVRHFLAPLGEGDRDRLTTALRRN